MTQLYGVIVVLHLLGMAGIVGGWMAALREPRILPPMLYGAIVSLVTGLVLVGLSYPLFDGDTINNVKITVKLVVALVIAVLVWVNRRRDSIPRGLLQLIGLLGTANVFVAVLWDDRFSF